MGNRNRKATREEMARATRVIAEAYPGMRPVWGAHGDYGGHRAPRDHTIAFRLQDARAVSIQRHLGAAGLARAPDGRGARERVMPPKQDRMDPRRRDVHAVDDDGMVACNPRDREAAHRAEVAGIVTTADRRQVTCAKCLAAIRGRSALDD